jgi:hypothetical protein
LYSSRKRALPNGHSFANFTSPAFHWMRFDVMHDFAEVRFLADVTIPIIVLPQFAATAEQSVDATRREAFPVLDQLLLWRLPDFDEQMDVVGHHREASFLLRDGSGARVAQLATARTAIQILLDFRPPL